VNAFGVIQLFGRWLLLANAAIILLSLLRTYVISGS